MRIEVTIAKRHLCLPVRLMRWRANSPAVLAIIFRRIWVTSPCYATANNLSVIGASKEDKERISEILRETWRALMTGSSMNKNDMQ